MFRKILVIVFILSTSTLYSQKYLGIIGGVNYTMLTPYDKNGNKNEIKSRFSYTLGTSFQINIYKKFDLLMELDYSNYSATITSIVKTDSSGGHYKYDLNLGYASISILPQYSFGKNKIFFLSAGPFLSVLINSNRDGFHSSFYHPQNSIYYGEYYENLSGSADSYFKRLDFGIISSIGFKFRISDRLSILPIINYRLGLINIGKNYFKTYNLSIFNRNASLVVRMDINLSKKASL